MQKQHITEVDIEYMTDTSAAMLEGVPIAFHMILWTAIFFLFVAGVWANYAVLDVVTVGEGKVIPSTNIQVVQNLEGGIVKAILVKVGNVVEQGQTLVVIEDTRFSSSLKEIEVQMVSLEAKIARLEAEAKGQPLAFDDNFEEKYKRYDFMKLGSTQGAQDEHKETLQKLYNQYQALEIQLYGSRKNGLEVQSNILKNELEQRDQELKALQGHKEQLERSVDLVKRELQLTKPLVKEGAVSEVELLRLERSVNDLQGELDSTITNIPKVESAVAGAKRKIEEIDINFKTGAYSDLNSAKADYAKLTETSRAALDRVERTIVRSPVKGTVNQVKITTIGGIIQPGQDLIEIVPLGDTLLIEANIRPSDIGFLRPGLPALVKISAYDFSIYGGLKAEVENISADTIQNERGESFYQIKVRTTEKTNLVGKHGEILEIIPGMSATVDILTGQKTVLEYLLKPIMKAKNTAMRER